MTTSKRRVDLTTDARQDFRAILRYSRNVWGEDQRDRYARQLVGAMERHTRNPDLGTQRDQFAP